MGCCQSEQNKEEVYTEQNIENQNKINAQKNANVKQSSAQQEDQQNPIQSQANQVQEKEKSDQGISQSNLQQEPAQKREDEHKENKKEIVISNKHKSNVKNSSSSLLEQYTIGKVLGEGGFGTVCLVTHKATGIVRAMKMINKKKMQKNEEDRLFEELAILRDIDHPNIVKVFEHFQDEKYHYLISEYCTGGELFERIKEISPFTEKVAALYMKQILSAISYCHINNICHRDLKPENILFDTKNANLKVIDFGASTKFDPSKKLTKRIGTPFYVAPEILSKLPYDEKCDVWSLGVIMYIMLCGYPPFWGSNDREIYDKVKKGKYEFYSEDWDHISEDAKDLINKMLKYSPAERIAATEAYAHPWIQSNVFVEPLDGKMMKKLSTFDAKNKIRVSILSMMANQVVSSAEKENLIKNFQAIDTNGDGMLSKQELIEGYTKVIGDPLKAKDIVDKTFGDLDHDGSGKVDFSEFMVASLQKEKLFSKDKIDAAFKLIDEDGNGQITKQELDEMMGGFQDQEVWNQLLQEVDQNGDGMINYKEFIDLLVKTIEKEGLM